MRKFTCHHGIAAPLLRSNIDTDAIIPSVEMKQVSKAGLADGLFAAWRYTDRIARIPNPGFILNKPEFSTASILLAGENFGCGSSREHAVWALDQYGIRAIIAPSFGGIFKANCIANGLLPVSLPWSLVQEIASEVTNAESGHALVIDLQQRLISTSSGTAYKFQLAESDAAMLLNGWDPIELTLQMDEKIRSFHARDRQARPWVYLSAEINT